MKSKTYLEELRNKSVDELSQELVKNTARITEVRKNIARIQTVISSKAE